MPADHEDDDTAPQQVLRLGDDEAAAELPAPVDPASARLVPAGEPRRGRVWVAAAVAAGVVAIAATTFALVRQSPAAAVPPSLSAPPASTPAPSSTDSAVAAAPPPHVLPAGQDTLVLGDSLALIVYPWLADLLPDRYVSYVADVGSGTGWAVSQLQQLRAAHETIPKVVLVSDGTNDFSAQQFRLDATALLAELGPNRCVAWATVSRPDVINGEQVDPAEQLNAVLRELASTHPNLHLIDWAALAASHPSWFDGDAIHPIEDGAVARSDQFAAAAKLCSPLDPTAPTASKQYLPNSVFYGGTQDGSTQGTTTYSAPTPAYPPSRSVTEAPRSSHSRAPRPRTSHTAAPTAAASSSAPSAPPVATAPPGDDPAPEPAAS